MRDETVVDGMVLKAPEMTYWTRTKDVWETFSGDRMSLEMMEMALGRSGQEPRCAHTEDWVLLPARLKLG